MITLAQKPGLFAYWVTRCNIIDLAGHVCIENTEVIGYGRFVPIDLPGLWALPFIKIFEDGDHWCALVGDNLQEGTAEFTPITERDKFDQVTDFGLEFQAKHPDAVKRPGKFEYWLPNDIALMARQARARAA